MEGSALHTSRRMLILPLHLFEVAVDASPQQGVAELLERFALQLAYPLAGEAEALANLFEGQGGATTQAVAQLDDVALSGGQV